MRRCCADAVPLAGGTARTAMQAKFDSESRKAFFLRIQGACERGKRLPFRQICSLKELGHAFTNLSVRGLAITETVHDHSDGISAICFAGNPLTPGHRWPRPSSISIGFANAFATPEIREIKQSTASNG
jgi:hypothetical protein